MREPGNKHYDKLDIIVFGVTGFTGFTGKPLTRVKGRVKQIKGGASGGSVTSFGGTMEAATHAGNISPA